MQWDVGGPHCPIILQRMFVHAAEEEQKEAERFICCGHQHALPRLDPEVDIPAVQLVGFQTSQRENWDLYHEVYLLRRLPSLPPCGPNQIEEAIQDILSSLRSHSQRCEGTAMLMEGQRGATATAPWPSHQTRSHSQSQGRDYPHDEALWEAREAHQLALEAAHVLELNINRLSQEVEGIQCQHPHSRSCCQSRYLDRHERSPSQHRRERHVTFLDPEEGAPSGERPHQESQGHSTRAPWERDNVGPLPAWRLELECFWERPTTCWGTGDRWGYLPELSIENYKLWLGLQACRLDTSHWWEELITIPEAGGPKELAWKICTSFDISAVRGEALWNQDYTMPLLPNASPGVGSSSMMLLTKMSGGSHYYWPWPMLKHCNIG